MRLRFESVLTLGPAVAPLPTLLVEQTARGHEADDQAHAAQDGDDRTQGACYDNPAFNAFVQRRPVERGTEQLESPVTKKKNLKK